MQVQDKFILKKDNEIIDELTLEMYDSGNTGYGNGHGIMLKSKNFASENLFDARYDARFENEKTFHEHSYEFVRDYVRKDFEVIKV